LDTFFDITMQHENKCVDYIKLKILLALLSLVMVGLGGVCQSFGLEISVAPGFMYYTWKEHPPGGDVKESGYLPTIVGSIADAPSKQNMPELRLYLDVKGFFGQVDYDTRTQSGTPLNTDSSYWGFKFDGRTGWRLMALDHSYIEPFIGLVYGIWVRDIENTTVTPLGPVQGYSEFYQTLNGRIGIQTSVSLKVDSLFGFRPKDVLDTVIQLGFSMDPMLWTREQIDYPGVGRVVLQNGRRLGWTIEGGMLWWRLDTKVFWQAVRLGTSNIVSGLYQPKSDQDMVGFQLGYHF
jgi:hypothetical protein